MARLRGGTRPRRIPLIAVLAIATAAPWVGLPSVLASPAADAFELYSMAVSARTVLLGGDIGLSGGLVTFDQGVPMVRGAVDSAPAATARASYLDTGVLPATLVGVGNNQIGSGASQANAEGLPLPTPPPLVLPNFADAAYPAGADRQDPKPATLLERQDVGLAAVEGGMAEAHAKEGRSLATASLERLSVADGVIAAEARNPFSALRTALASVRGAHPRLVAGPASEGDSSALVQADSLAASLDLSASQKAGTLAGTVDSTAGRLLFMGGQISVDSVEVHVTLASDGSDAGRKVRASMVVGRVSIGGIPVHVGPDGVEVAGNPAVGPEEIAQATEALNAALAQAQIQVTAPGARSVQAPGSAGVITDALVISLVTPSAPETDLTPPGTVPSNRLEVMVGHVEADVTDTLAQPVPEFESPVETVETYVPGTETIVAGASYEPPPSSPRRVARPGVAVATASNRAVLFLVLGLWQALGLSGLTAAVLVSTRRSKLWELDA